MNVVVFGSINMDLVARVHRLPATGETMIGQKFDTLPGGKGANQAVAVARLGTSVSMVGRVGNDVFGPQLIHALQESGVQCDRISTAPGSSSGVATIEVDAEGNNRIIVIPGANQFIEETDLENLRGCLSTARILMLQLEIPMPMVRAAAKLAADSQVTVMLDPAPAPEHLPTDVLASVNILTPNQLEAAQWVGFPVNTLEEAERAAYILRDYGPDTVIITLGAQGSVCVTASDEVIHTPCYPTQVIDTVAAGDAFNGGLASALAEGKSLQDSLRWATATAAVAVSREGAQSAMPTTSELHALFTF